MIVKHSQLMLVHIGICQGVVDDNWLIIVNDS